MYNTFDKSNPQREQNSYLTPPSVSMITGVYPFVIASAIHNIINDDFPACSGPTIPTRFLFGIPLNRLPLNILFRSNAGVLTKSDDFDISLSDITLTCVPFTFFSNNSLIEFNDIYIIPPFFQSPYIQISNIELENPLFFLILLIHMFHRLSISFSFIPPFHLFIC